MMAYIAIDGGTTNTRICLVKNSKVIDILNFNVGARLGIENKKILENTMKKGIEEILKRNSLKEQDISKILASGMLTCEFGILQLDHIETPVGIKELHDSMVEITLEKISPIPFVFIRGVKTSCTNIDNADMMCGEESELIGLADDIKSCVFILPGSHSKIIQTDDEGRITEFTTMRNFCKTERNESNIIPNSFTRNLMLNLCLNFGINLICESLLFNEFLLSVSKSYF